MNNICENCIPLSETKSEYDEWEENGCQKAAEIIKNTEEKNRG